MSELVDLRLRFVGQSIHIAPEGLTVHYGGDSPWSGADRSSAERFFATTDHNRCASIVRAWHDYHLSKGWFGLAYNSVVCPHGTRFEGRGVGKRSGANGSDTGNYRSPAVVYIGGGNDPVTDQAKYAFAAEAERFRVPLRWPHQFWTSTTCPGVALLNWQKSAFPLPAIPSIPSDAAGSTKQMISISTNNDGRGEEFRIINNKVHTRWQNAPNGGWSDYHSMHAPGDDPGAFDQVGSYRNADGRLEVVAFHSAFGVTFRKWQTKPGEGPWSKWGQ